MGDYWGTIIGIVIIGAFCLFVYSGFKKQTIKETMKQIWEWLGMEEEKNE